MEISGDLLIGKQTVRGTNGSIKGINAATGEPLAPAFGGASLDQLDLSPQCGFATNLTGSPLTLEDERAKLRLVVDVASEVWKQ